MTKENNKKPDNRDDIWKPLDIEQIERKSFWETFGKIAMIATVFGFLISLSIIGYNYYLNKKNFDVVQISITQPFDTEFLQSNKDFVITYRKNAIPNYSIARIKLINSGNQDIPKEDFQEPIVITFIDCDKIISFRKISSNPRNIGLKYNIEDCKVKFNNVLFNHGDEYIFDVGVIPSKDLRIAQPGGRITGIKEIKLKRSEIKEKSTISLITTYIIIIDIILIFTLALLYLVPVILHYKRFRYDALMQMISTIQKQLSNRSPK